MGWATENSTKSIIHQNELAKYTGTFCFGLRGLTAKRFVLNPIFSPTAIASSVVPVLEHSFLKLKKSLLFLKN